MISLMAVYVWIFYYAGLVASLVPFNDNNSSSYYTDYEKQYSKSADDSIKIGMIVTKRDEQGLMAIRGAQMGLEEANQQGGYRGKPFQLLVKDCEGPWGLTSKRVTSLIYDDEVRVILASLDGRNAHLAEQVTTKTHVPLISTRATEATLTQAYIPWYFRCTPSDKQQVQILYEEIFIKRGFRSIGIIKSDNYEDQLAAFEFDKLIKTQELTNLKITIIDYSSDTYQKDLGQLRNPEIEAIVIFSGKSYSDDLIDMIRKNGINKLTYTDLSFTTFGLHKEQVRFISPSGWYEKRGENFKIEYYSRFGQNPGLAAAYAYDGIKLVAKAINIAGLNREAIKEELGRIFFCDGITGCIKFDENGNRQVLPILLEIRDGKPVLVE